MTETDASNLLRQHGLKHGMVDAEYQPARWMFEAVIAAIAAELEASAERADAELKRTCGRGLRDAVRDAIMKRSNI